MASLAAGLIIVYYADSHPQWRHRQARPHPDTQPDMLAGRQQSSRGPDQQRRAA